MQLFGIVFDCKHSVTTCYGELFKKSHVIGAQRLIGSRIYNIVGIYRSALEMITYKRFYDIYHCVSFKFGYCLFVIIPAVVSLIQILYVHPCRQSVEVSFHHGFVVRGINCIVVCIKESNVVVKTVLTDKNFILVLRRYIRRSILVCRYPSPCEKVSTFETAAQRHKIRELRIAAQHLVNTLLRTLNKVVYLIRYTVLLIIMVYNL